ncbi:hypothetical protein PI126_g21808 [Phytophthora idaei]|nr:hypothetical protein PI126_g21808 [Phytophthora idaei]
MLTACWSVTRIIGILRGLTPYGQNGYGWSCTTCHSLFGGS